MKANMATTNATTQPQYARAKKAAAHFQISVSTLWGWAKNRTGFPPILKASKRVSLFDLGKIDAFLKSERAEK
jgi:predicted DNA-binding transcriptional regulator AlpA